MYYVHVCPCCVYWSLSMPMHPVGVYCACVYVHARLSVCSMCAVRRKWLCLFKLSTLSHVGQFSGNQRPIPRPPHLPPTHHSNFHKSVLLSSPILTQNLLNGRLSFEGWGVVWEVEPIVWGGKNGGGGTGAGESCNRLKLKVGPRMRWEDEGGSTWCTEIKV